MREALIEEAVARAPARCRILPDDFEPIVREHQQRIYRILFLMLRDADEADNLTQECFLRAFSRRAGFRGEAEPGTWLVRIALNLARDQLKSRRASFWRRLLRGREIADQALADRHSSPEDSLLARERLEAVWTAVESLPMRQRTVFTLRFGEDMTLAEIARILKLREGTVKAHLAQANNAIRRALERLP